MIIDVPASVVNFCLQFLPTLAELAPAHVASLLPVTLAAVASSSASRYSLSSLARQVYGQVRHKSTLCRMVSCRDFRSRDLHWDLVRRALKVLVLFARRGAWLVALDATSLQR